MDYKFWFAVQDTVDLLEYGEEEDEMLHATIPFENLQEIKDKVKRLKKDFEVEFEISYKEFMDKIEKKGYTGSSDDPETNTDKWNDMCKSASLINLGVEVIKSLKDKGEDLYVEAEY